MTELDIAVRSAWNRLSKCFASDATFYERSQIDRRRLEYDRLKKMQQELKSVPEESGK